MSVKRLATCPTCKQTGEFQYLGEQRWPIEVARKYGLPPVIVLWSCPNCRTTVSEPDLQPPRQVPGSQSELAGAHSGLKR